MVLGVPKYSDHVIGIAMSTDLVENFRLEKVTNPEILKAAYTNRLQEEFEKGRDMPLTSCWGQSDQDRGNIEKWVGCFSVLEGISTRRLGFGHKSVIS